MPEIAKHLEPESTAEPRVATLEEPHLKDESLLELRRTASSSTEGDEPEAGLAG
eukprot:CAMPEP_0181236126 /NCGR_PEP_ID=MMETSP1096-20121128/37989_1 /TAXON_ID=156174 ORGANISM="Chrysochromulina ericina, Strain CCMP281" /NCGR_SAMPLE_ID=MMETSP1096 /ASSEMBLY_ACC=CAM_ASM_000453 /LENGTH=53 /DNA_ID=CAMNT_0023331245 /DNA_START=13 /DNA_END=170 /DNA_ORIENTATION=+